jgi:hypothetical protein
VPLLLLGLLLNLVVFTFVVDNGVIRNDYWRFVPLIDDYASGEMRFAELVRSTNSPLKSLWVPVLTILDGVLLDLDLVAIHYLGSITLLLSALVVYGEFRRSLADRKRVALWFVPLALVLLSPKLQHLLIYGQAAFSMIRMCAYLVALVALSRLLSVETARRRDVILVSLCLPIAVVFFGGQYLPGLVVAVLALVGVKALVDREGLRTQRGALGVSLGVFAASVAVYALTLIDWSQASSRENKGVAGFLSAKAEALAGPLDYVTFYLTLLGNSLMGGTLFADQRPPSPLVAVVGLVCLGLIVLALRAYFRQEVWRRTLLPAALILYPLAIIALITAARTNFGPGPAQAGRYLADTTLWQVGALWILADARAPLGAGGAALVGRRITLALSRTLVVVLFASVALDLHLQWSQAGHYREKFQVQRLALLYADEFTTLELSNELRENVRISRSYLDDGLAILRERGWNVFRDEEAAAAAAIDLQRTPRKKRKPKPWNRVKPAEEGGAGKGRDEPPATPEDSTSGRR